MRIHRVAFSAALLLQIASFGSTAQAQSTTMAGSTPGQFSVSQSGAAVYRIPIQVPPGVAGMAPKLELVYNSQSGNGTLGKGWGLAGLSAISRCPRTKASDGVSGSVSLNADDRFCLDGQRLILVGGNHWAVGSEYRTERESYSKVVFDGSAFTVKTKSGLTMQYGATSDSLIEAQGSAAVRTWALKKITDLVGNYLTVSYTEDNANGDYRPSRIDYTANATLAPNTSVQLVYADRTDITPLYLAGSQLKTMQRLTRLQTYVGASLVKDYRLDYAAQPTALDKSKLAAVTECDGAGVCLPAHALAWGAPGADTFVTTASTLAAFGTGAGGWTDNNTYPRYMVDVNGDGLPDIVGFGPSGVTVALNNGTTFASPVNWSSEFNPAGGWTDNKTFPRQLVDVNGDGLPDIVGFGPSGVMLALNTGTATGFAAAANKLAAFGTAAGGWTDNNLYPRQVVDINGDGLPDIVGFDANGLSVALNTGGNFDAPSYWMSNQFGTNQGWTDNTVTPRQLIDVNGDGLPDIVGFSRGGVYVVINTGSGFVAPNYTCAAGSSVSGFSCATSYAATPVYSCANGGHIAPTDGDAGAPDCVPATYGHEYTLYPAYISSYSCPSGGSVYATTCTKITAPVASFTCPAGYVTSGTSCVLSGQAGAMPISWQLADFGVDQGWADNKVAPRFVMDVNGDGLPDIVGFGPNGVMVALNTGTSFAPATNWITSFGSNAGGWSDYNTYPRQLIDVNGDGLPDVVGFSSTGVMVALNTGTSFMPATSWISSFGTTAGGWSDNTTYPRMLIDVNGDGMPDIVGFSSAGVVVATDSRSAAANFVSNLNNGVGQVTTPSYAALTTAGTYTMDVGANKAVFPLLDLNVPLYVVNSVVSTNGAGATNTSNYSYGGLKAELGTGRGMLGFRWVKSKEMATNLEAYTEYRQDWPYVGMASKNETRLSGAGNAGVLKRTTATLACKVPWNGYACVIQSRCDLSGNAALCKAAADSRYFLYASSTLEEGWDLDGASYPSITTTADYAADSVDQHFYGDLRTSTVSTSDGASKTSVNEYFPTDAGNWILGRLKKTTATSVKP